MSKILRRDITNKVNWLLDNVIPPILRDSRVFMSFLMYPLFRENTKNFLDFKDYITTLEGEELEEKLKEYYAVCSGVNRLTDLNDKCIDFILNNIVGTNILDIACGKGFLSRKIAELFPEKHVTGIDFNISRAGESELENLEFKEGSILSIPYSDGYFDTTICAHTLEHLVDPLSAVKELRRVTKKRLIIVVPQQREYKYTFDLHLHFFPYEYSLFIRLGVKKDAKIYNLNNDFLIIEECRHFSKA